MALSKQQVRRAVARGMYTLVTTGNGAAGGGTFVCTDFDGKGTDFAKNWWAVVESGGGGLQGYYTQVKSFSGTNPATFTVTPPLGTTIGSGITIGLYPYKPSMYTDAFNLAITDSYPSLHVGVLDNSLVVVANTWDYTLPAGITPHMVRAVAIEGDGDFEAKPYQWRDDWAFSPDGTELWLGKSNRPYRTLTTDRIIYLLAEQYLTAFTTDSTTVLATDTTATLELDTADRHFRLFDAFVKANLYDQLASFPQYEEKNAMLQMALAARATAVRLKGSLSHAPVRSPVWV